VKSISNGALFELKRAFAPSVTTTDLIYEAIRKLRKELLAEIRQIVKEELRLRKYRKE
jgi:hypothetical protein